jgi:hypothetical protein
MARASDPIAEKRRRVVERLLKSDAITLSDREIARQVGVSQPFVGKVRRILLRPRVITKEHISDVPPASNNATPHPGDHTVFNQLAKAERAVDPDVTGNIDVLGFPDPKLITIDHPHAGARTAITSDHVHTRARMSPAWGEPLAPGWDATDAAGSRQMFPYTSTRSVPWVTEYRAAVLRASIAADLRAANGHESSRLDGEFNPYRDGIL